MKQIIGLFFLLIIGHPKPVYSGAYLADFFSVDFGPYASDSCWKKDNTFNEYICDREEVSCAFEGWTQNLNKIPLTLDFASEYLKNVDYHLTLKINLGPKELTETLKIAGRRLSPPIEIAKNAQATIYNEEGLNYGRKFNILYQGIIPNDGKLSQLAERDISEEVFIKTDKNDKNSYRIDILGDYIYHNNDFGTKLLLSEGSYPITIFNGSNKTQFETTLIVKKSKKVLQKVITINPSHFKDVPKEVRKMNLVSFSSEDEVPGLRLEWQEEHNEAPLYVKEVHTFTVDNKTNLANFFEIYQGKPQISSDQKQQFGNALIKHPIHQMKMSGTCFQTKPKDAVKDFPVKKKPNHESPTLGKVVVQYDRHKNDMHVFYETTEGKKEDLKSLQHFETNCRGQGYVSGVIAVKEVNQGFVNLNKGPWGDHGWIELPYKDISQWVSNFAFRELSNVSFVNRPNGKYFVTGEDPERSETPITEHDEGSPEIRSSFTLEAEKLWDKNGDFRLQTDCSFGY